MSRSNPPDAQMALRLKHLIDASLMLGEVESVTELFPRLLKIARQVTDACAASLMIYQPESQTLRFAWVEDEILGDKALDLLHKAGELKLGQGLAGWAAENLEPVLIEDAQNDPRFNSSMDKSTGYTTRTLMTVPLHNGPELLGVITVLNAKQRQSFDLDDLDIMTSFANLASMALVRNQLLEKRVQAERMQVEMESAASIQRLFWPQPLKSRLGSHCWVMCRPAGFVGGDIYDLIPTEDGNWLFYVADVSGKGISAALLTAALSFRVRAEVLYCREPGELMSRINAAMFELLSGEGHFVTMLLGSYDPASGQVTWARAGHPDPIWMHEQKLREVPSTEGLTLGVIDDAEFSTAGLTLMPGDSLVIYSDGLHEAENPDKEIIGLERVSERLRQEPAPPRAPCLTELAQTWYAGAEPNDDFTLLELWREPE